MLRPSAAFRYFVMVVFTSKGGSPLRNTKRLLQCLLTISLFASAGYSQALLTAREIINKMSDVYAQCATYRDQGKVKEKSGKTVSFTTLFQWPSLFKFEYFGATRFLFHDHQVIWRTRAGDVQMWW